MNQTYTPQPSAPAETDFTTEALEIYRRTPPERTGELVQILTDLGEAHMRGDNTEVARLIDQARQVSGAGDLIQSFTTGTDMFVLATPGKSQQCRGVGAVCPHTPEDI